MTCSLSHHQHQELAYLHLLQVQLVSSCTVLEHGINFMEIISTLHVLYSCMEAQCMHISGIQEYLHRQTALLYFRLLSVTLSARV